MVLLYIADNGFSFYEGKYYFTRPNYNNTKQFGKYFDKVIYVAREASYIDGSIQIPDNSNVYLFKKMDFSGIRKWLKTHASEYDVALLRNGMNGCIAVNTLHKINKPIISYLGYDALAHKLLGRTMLGFVEGVVWYLLEKNKMAKGTYAHYCADNLAKRYPAKVPYLVCPNIEIEIDDNNLKCRINKYKLGKDKKVVGILATLNSYKGIDTAIKSLTLLPGNYSLEVVGGGKSDEYVRIAQELKVDNRVHFMGYFAEQEKIKDWLKEIDIYIQPSISEGLPRAAIEAMSMGCPLIVSNTIGVSSWIDQSWQIKPRDYKKLAEKILLMGNDAENMIQQASKNFETSKMFRPEIRDSKMDSYYKDFLDSVDNKK